MQQKVDRLDALADSTTFDGERAAAERVAAPLRARLDALRSASGEPKAATLCDDCARLLSFAIDDLIGDDGLRGERVWAGAEKICDRCWRTMRAEK